MSDSAQGATPSSFEARRLGRSFAAEVRGCDVRAAVENPARFAELLDLFHAHRVLVFPEQELTPRELLGFAHLFGEIRPHPDQRFCVPDCPEVMLIGNLKEGGQYRSLFVNSREEWHADLTYTATPNKATMLYALNVPPEGGDTMFADMVAAYDSLGEGLRAAIEGRGAVYDYVCMDAVLREHDPGRPPLTAETRRKLAPVTHPLAADPPGHRAALALSFARGDQPCRGHGGCGVEGFRGPPPGARNARPACLSPPLAGRRSGAVGQPLHQPFGDDVRRRPLPAAALPLHRRGRAAGLTGLSGSLYRIKRTGVQSPLRLTPHKRRPALAGLRNPNDSNGTDFAPDRDPVRLTLDSRSVPD